MGMNVGEGEGSDPPLIPPQVSMREDFFCAVRATFLSFVCGVKFDFKEYTRGSILEVQCQVTFRANREHCCKF